MLDLTVSNPTRAAIPYPSDELAAALADGARRGYDPDPRGLVSAREALGRALGCDASALLLTASTSEAYSYLFKLLADPGQAVVTATPSYPLLEHLAAMEQVELRPFELEYHRRWVIDPERLRAAITPAARAVLVVNPNNPTGSFIDSGEHALLCAAGLPLISDEVFLDYGLEGHGHSLAGGEVLTFALGGLSKSAGLPHFKLGWIRVTGPGCDDALDALESIADNFLSVATPVQAALPAILSLAPSIRTAISTRTRNNLDAARSILSGVVSSQLLPVEGGWSAVIRVPRLRSDEDLALALLDRDVLVQPGYFFDFASEGFLVVSLLTPVEEFKEGMTRLAGLVAEWR